MRKQLLAKEPFRTAGQMPGYSSDLCPIRAGLAGNSVERMALFHGGQLLTFRAALVFGAAIIVINNLNLQSVSATVLIVNPAVSAPGRESAGTLPGFWRLCCPCPEGAGPEGQVMCTPCATVPAGSSWKGVPGSFSSCHAVRPGARRPGLMPASDPGTRFRCQISHPKQCRTADSGLAGGAIPDRT